MKLTQKDWESLLDTSEKEYKEHSKVAALNLYMIDRCKEELKKYGTRPVAKEGNADKGQHSTPKR